MILFLLTKSIGVIIEFNIAHCLEIKYIHNTSKHIDRKLYKKQNKYIINSDTIFHISKLCYWRDVNDRRKWFYCRFTMIDFIFIIWY